MVALPLLLVVALGAEPEVVLLNFTQANCPPCRAMEPVLAQVEAAGLTVQPIDVEQHPQYAQRFAIQGTPTFVMLVDGREAGRVVGVTSAEKLTALLPSASQGQLRGQSPDAGTAGTDSSYLKQRLGGMFGKGSLPSASAASSNTQAGGDPFAGRQSGSIEQAPAGSRTAPRGEDPQARAMAAAVRLKVHDAQGHSIGSGTIIDTHGDEAVIITCGHIFRESKGEGRIAVDLFYPTTRTIEGKLLDYDLKRDIAMVSIAPGAGVVSAPVAPQGLAVQMSDAAFSVGCDKGQDPSLKQTKITGLDRYVGPPNIEAAGEPVDGRSGGGLFSRDGYLIGVCNAADKADNEGIYAALGTIHHQLAKVGLNELFERQAEQASVSESSERGDARLAEAPRSVPDLPSRSAESPVAAASSDEGDTEIICIVRSKRNPSAKGQLFLIQRATPQLIEQLAASSADPTVAADLALQADRRNALSPTGSAGPVVRGQSRR